MSRSTATILVAGGSVSGRLGGCRGGSGSRTRYTFRRQRRQHRRAQHHPLPTMQRTIRQPFYTVSLTLFNSTDIFIVVSASFLVSVPCARTRIKPFTGKLGIHWDCFVGVRGVSFFLLGLPLAGVSALGCAALGFGFSVLGTRCTSYACCD